MNNSRLNYYLKHFIKELHKITKSKSKSEKEIIDMIVSFNDLISEKKETKEDIKRHTALLENLQFDHNQLLKRQQYIEDNVLLAKANDLTDKAQAIKAKIKELFTQMYYNKELVQSTQLKINHQSKEINQYAIQYPQLKHEICKINKKIRPIYDKQLENYNMQLETNIKSLENECNQEEAKNIKTIKSQDSEIRLLKAEIDELNNRRNEIKTTAARKAMNDRTVILTKPISFNSSVSSKRIIEKEHKDQKNNIYIEHSNDKPKRRIKIKRQLSIEPKTKRKPFANFIFISTDPFLVEL